MKPNTFGNRIDLSIPPDQLQAISGAIQLLVQQLLPHLVSLGTEDRRAMPRMGDKTSAFVDKALAYARSHPEYKPGFIDLDSFQRDVDAIDILRPMQQALGQVQGMLEDSLAVAGSEAYTAALACYQSIKTAAKLNQPGAVTMFDDLSTRFQGMGRQPAKAGAAPSA